MDPNNQRLRLQVLNSTNPSIRVAVAPQSQNISIAPAAQFSPTNDQRTSSTCEQSSSAVCSCPSSVYTASTAHGFLGTRR